MNNTQVNAQRHGADVVENRITPLNFTSQPKPHDLCIQQVAGKLKTPAGISPNRGKNQNLCIILNHLITCT